MSENFASTKKIAIVLFNLGGPDSLNSVKPFLFNLFYDPLIVRLPNPLRWIIAKLVSVTRSSKAKEIYHQIGGKSPILEETENQKKALTAKLNDSFKDNFEVFICMRHWHPMSREVVKKIKKYNPSEIILLPLYPQFSTTTTGSAINDFIKEFGSCHEFIPIKATCCYYTDQNFIKAHIFLIKQALKNLASKKNYRILFSAHSLPVKIIKSGDSYQWQIENTVKKIINSLKIGNLDYKITYQSRVGPIKWLEPDTKDEIEKAGIEKKSLIIVPISFVSEHVETLVELDIEYKKIADKHKIEYIRVPTLRANENFINSLSNIIIKLSNTDSSIICSNSLNKLCDNKFTACPYIKQKRKK